MNTQWHLFITIHKKRKKKKKPHFSRPMLSDLWNLQYTNWAGLTEQTKQS
jgi:hypothetical protein